MKFKFLSHIADIKFQAFGKTKEECFENAAYALKEVITKDKINPLIKKTIKVKGRDIESLLYNFLEEFLFLMDSENLILSKIIEIKTKLTSSADAEGHKKFELSAETYFDNIKKYKTITDVKAITYNDMFIIKDKKGYKSQVVVDV